MVHSLPIKQPRPAKQSFLGDSRTIVFSKELTDQIVSTATKHGMTPFMIIHAAFNLLIARLSNESDVAIGIPVANRALTEVEPLIGFFVNNLVLRTTISDNPDVSSYLNRVKTTHIDAQANQDVTFDMLVEKLNPARSQSHSPLFQIMIVMDDFFAADNDISELTISSIAQQTVIAKYDLTLFVRYTDTFNFALEYNTDLFESGYIERILDYMRVITQSLCRNHNKSVLSLPLFDESEKNVLLSEHQEREHRVSTFDLIRAFDSNVRNCPTSIAVSDPVTALTYLELDNQIEQMIGLLKDQGVEFGDVVGISLPRNHQLLVALIAVLKLGGIYTPVETNWPGDRKQFVLADSGAKVVVTYSDLDVNLDHAGLRVLNINDLSLSTNSKKHGNQAVDWRMNNSDAIAYILYTSGSTGVPKGVQIEHSGLNNYLDHVVRQYWHDKITGSVVSSPLSFDATITTLYSGILTGKVVKFLADTSNILFDLADEISTSKASLFKVTPAHLEGLCHIIEAPVSAEHMFVVGGEQLNYSTINKIRSLLPNTTFINEYGPTETVVGCSYFTIYPEHEIPHNGPVPIGQPIQNTDLLIVNQALEMQPLRSEGELLICGAGVSIGYINRDELNEQKFISVQYNRDDKTKVPGYLSGDIVRYNQEGLLEFVGRRDHQIKIRGFRIETGEIECQINSLSFIGSSLVVVRDDNIFAYVILTDDKPDLFKEVTGALRDWLPDYMIPTFIIALEAFPQTANGKVDLTALPEPEIENKNIQFQTPENETEEMLAQIWAELLSLNVEEISRTANFFELGGHSLLALQMVSMINKNIQNNIPLASIFEAKNLEALASNIMYHVSQSAVLFDESSALNEDEVEISL
ncbi:Linear gramicidin synthase subunit D [Pseudoalteromonas sp. P1-9]|nr:Linear gramicidin synthase subunit D [Pseudoalteromonas sp. P1-9]